MFTHIVLFKLKDKTKINETIDILKEMNNNIPEIIDLEVGKDVMHGPASYDISIIVKFKNEDDYQIYDKSEYHQNEILAKIRDNIESIAKSDY